MRYFEDFHVGDTFDLGQISVTEEGIISFARQFDPQPFHVDLVQAKNSFFGELVASGWHTTALFMRLLVDGLLNESASLASPGVEHVRWLKPVRPGDTLSARFTVIESASCRGSIARDRGRASAGMPALRRALPRLLPLLLQLGLQPVAAAGKPERGDPSFDGFHKGNANTLAEGKGVVCTPSVGL